MVEYRFKSKPSVFQVQGALGYNILLFLGFPFPPSCVHQHCLSARVWVLAAWPSRAPLQCMCSYLSFLFCSWYFIVSKEQKRGGVDSNGAGHFLVNVNVLKAKTETLRYARIGRHAAPSQCSLGLSWWTARRVVKGPVRLSSFPSRVLCGNPPQVLLPLGENEDIGDNRQRKEK